MKDIIQTRFTEADVTKVEEFITNLETEIAGKTETLNADERVRYGSINEQNKLVVNKAWQYRQSQPALSAPNVDWTEFEKDFNARNHLEN
ncbi:MAG TPA: hypothetical protein PKY59_16715 [Pyrinomonadaceae bacterium]|nr:hypothetical protein [Pyrinomonadaceae bacterium]